MVYLKSVSKLGLCAIWMVTVFGNVTVNAETSENKSREESLAQLKAKAQEVKPFVAKYSLSGPRGALRAEIGVGENNSFYLKVVSDDPQNKMKLPACWRGEDGRLFMRTDGKTFLMPELPALADSVSALRASLFGDKNSNLVLYPNFRLEKGNLHLSVGQPDWIDVLMDDPTVEIGSEEPPRLKISSQKLGQLVVDGATATIVQQELDGRIMKRVQYEEDGATEKVDEEVKFFDPGEFESTSIRVAMPGLRMQAFVICQNAVNDVENAKLSVAQMKENMAAGGEQFMRTMDKAFLDSKKSFWDADKMDGYADNAYTATLKELKKKGLSEAKIDEMFQSIKPEDMSPVLAREAKETVELAGRAVTKQLAKDVILGELEYTTDEGKTAVELIENFLMESSLTNAALRACERQQRHLRNKAFD